MPVSYTIDQTIGMALRFLDRLGALTSQERSAIRLPEDPILYLEAVRQIRAALEADSGGDDLKRLVEFAGRADRQLDDLGVTDDLGAMAKEAVRSILIWPQAGVRTACQVVYQPFEHLVPFAVLV